MTFSDSQILKQRNNFSLNPKTILFFFVFKKCHLRTKKFYRQNFLLLIHCYLF